jgi:Domain of unknown function (DUF4389)
MTDPYSASGSSGPAASGAQPNPEPASAPRPPGARQPFPWIRLLYAIGFALIAWVLFWLILLLLAPLQFVTIAITGKPNDELQQMSMKAVHYLLELLVFITGASQEPPFPLGPFPKA